MNMEGSSERTAGDTAAKEPSAGSHDELWGRLVITVLLLGLLSTLAFFALLGYRIYDERREDGPSIADLPKSATPAEPVQEVAAATESNAVPEAPVSTDAKQAVITVLNGGGAKGSAGILADFLKAEGYLKVTVGNAQKDYSGATIYHAATLGKEAEQIKESVMKKYPQAKILPAEATNKETAVSQVTVILGK